MSTSIKLRRSAVPGKVPTIEQLDLGEVAINTHDGKLFIKKNDGIESVVTIGETPGFTGSRGDTGFTGSAGTNGFTGSAGTNGFTGSAGIIGFTGSQGADGSKGDTGFTGSQGVIGFTGSQGTTGFTGSKGDIGFTGSKGDIGYTGSVGFTGSRGASGFTGSQGTNGFTGSAGTNGFTGSAGANGFTGSAGTNGFTGSKGDNGYTGSAGFTGSIGSTGFTGSQGATGFTGSKGDIGYTGSAGIAYNWVRKTSNYTAADKDSIIADTTAGSFVITLPATPSLGARVSIVDGGDWSVNNLTIGRNGSTIEGAAEDLILDVADVKVDIVYDGSTWHVYANVGKTGYTGSAGTNGFTGSKGDNGYTGSVGFTGSRGASGFTGSQGATGFTGSKGDIGYTGSAGANGFTGSAGTNGFTGSMGPVAGTDGQLVYNNGGVSAGANVWFDDTNQRLGIGTSSPSATLQVNGSVSAVDFNSTSDIRFKEDLEQINGALEKVKAISGYTFTLKETGKRSTGVIAQEIEKVLPEVVQGDEDKKTVSYGNIVGLLIEAIKELSDKIDNINNLL